VLQGENDIRDPKEEAEQAFKLLTASGRTVQAQLSRRRPRFAPSAKTKLTHSSERSPGSIAI